MNGSDKVGLSTDCNICIWDAQTVLKFPIPFFLLSTDASSIPYIITDTAYSMFYLLFRTSVFICTEVLSLFDSCLVELSL